MNPDITYDLLVLGGGPAGYAAAIRAGQLGKKAVVVEMERAGGTCLNWGCIPSKALLKSAEAYQNALAAEEFGISCGEVSFDFEKVISRSRNVADQMGGGIEFLFKKNKVDYVVGTGMVHAPGMVEIMEGEHSGTYLKADKILIATGSTPTIPAINGLSGTPYWTSTEALFATDLPEHLVVIGSSVVALEIAQAYRRLGSEVTVLARHTLLYREDPLLGEELEKCFKKEGINVLTYTSAKNIAHDGKQFIIDSNNGQITSDRLLVSTGRHANTEKLNLKAVGVQVTERGEVMVDEKMQTNVEGIYAAGDCSNMPQFVYVAAAAGSRAGTNMTGGDVNLDLTTMPAVIFTDPQVATVGLTETQANQQGISTISRVLPMENVPRALANFETDGFIKLVAEESTGKLIGAQILAHEGGELVQSVAIAIINNMTVEELAGQLFPYLTMVEGLKLCAQTFNKDVSELSCCAA